jgi:hypothetical protein
VVATNAYVFSRVMLRAALTDEDVARFADFTAKNLNA